MNKEEKFFTQQWVNPDVARALQKSSISRPEFNVHVKEIEWHEDNDLVKIRLTFNNCGKNLFTQRLFAFLVSTFKTI